MAKVVSHFIAKAKKGRRFTISDIHGCYLTFKAILEKIQFQKEDQLFLVGDLINRGPHSNKVLNKVLKMKRLGFQVFSLRGNHEQMILNSLKKTKGQQKRILKANQSLTLMKDGEIKAKYIKLLKSSFHYIELEDYWLVHAGFNHKAMYPFEDTFAMLNTRRFKAKKKLFKQKPIVFGHTPTSISTIKKRVGQNKAKICIDSGCINYLTTGQGHLTCFELNTRTLYFQKNIDY